MATSQTSKPQAATSSRGPIAQAVGTYWRQSRRPLASLAFVVPLLALYEGGLLVLGPQAARNGADVWLRQLLDSFGFSQYFLLPALTVGLLLAWHHLAHDRWQLSPGVVYLMFAESAVLGLALLGVARVEGFVAQSAAWSTSSPLKNSTGCVIAGMRCQNGDVSRDFASRAELGSALGEVEKCHDGIFQQPASASEKLAMTWLTPRAAFLGRMVGYLGAGVYEEMLFRLMLLPPVAFLAKRLGARPAWRVAAAVISTSLVFSAAHYIGPHGDAFQPYTFFFRATAGAFFAVLFVYRGFGIAAGTHALYDIFVSLP